MALIMNMDPALGLGLNGFKVLPRQHAKCDVGALGSGGICVAKSTCEGALFPTNCGGGQECCFLNGCDVPKGSGNCKNDTRDPCDGQFFTGDLKDPPCQGPSEMRCCVKFADMVNGTSSSSTSITSATASATASSTSTASASTSTSSDNGLKGNQIGGIVGGVVGFVVVVVAVAFLWLWLRRKSQSPSPADDFSPVSTKRDKDGFSELPEYGSGVPVQEIGEGRQRFEVDAHGQELYEMEGHSPIAELDGGGVRKP